MAGLGFLARDVEVKWGCSRIWPPFDRGGVTQGPKGPFHTMSDKRGNVYLGPPVVPFYPFFGEGSPTKIDDRKKGTLIILTSLLEDLVYALGCWDDN